MISSFPDDQTGIINRFMHKHEGNIIAIWTLILYKYSFIKIIVWGGLNGQAWNKSVLAPY